MKILIRNVDVVTPNGVLSAATCAVEDGKILYIGNNPPACEREIDGAGGYLMPGFVDIHCHGAVNLDFMDADADGFSEIAAYHLAHGTTTMLATTLSDTPEATDESIRTFAAYREKYADGTLIGLHLEGPWFSAAQCGAQVSDYFRDPSEEELTELKTKYPFILRVSAAPEREGGMAFGRRAQALGILASVGHSDADFRKVEEANKNGYTLMTHLYSGMRGTVRENAYRIAGAVEAGLYLDDMNVEIIADGKHLPVELLKLIYKCKGADKICLITDASRACGLPEGTKSTIGSLTHGAEIVVEDGVAFLLDKTAFGGSVATFDRLVRTMAAAIGDDPVALAKMASTTPARLLGLADRGEIAAGKRADLVLMNERYEVQWVMQNGEIASAKQ